MTEQSPVLSAAQRARVQALRASREVLNSGGTTGALFTGSQEGKFPADEWRAAMNLIMLAVYIEDGAGAALAFDNDETGRDES